MTAHPPPPTAPVRARARPATAGTAWALLCVLAALGPPRLVAQGITWHVRDAVVWAQDQRVEGEVDTLLTRAGTLFVNGAPLPFEVPAPGRRFAVPVVLGEGENTLVARFEHDGTVLRSDTLRLTLGYRLRPEAYAYATADGPTVTLHGQVLANPEGSPLRFQWRQDPDNPAPVPLTAATDTLATALFPAAPPGEYYFDLLVVAADGDTARARTFVTVDASGIRPFDLWRDHAAWVDEAVLYEVTPYNFAANGRLADVTARLPELEALGVNTIWLQPVFATAEGGQGYDVTDYFRLRPDYGSEADLRALVREVHRRDMRVLLDFVPNHTSIRHPYARDAIAHGPASHYYDFYQRAPDGARYARHYNRRRVGRMDFIYYFWPELVNLNYDEPEVRRWMTEAGRYWIEAFDVDGYRIDAVWGVNARTPEAMQAWRFDLKRLKPEILLLGEDKATVPASFDRRFDAAYDWYPDEDWVSHWTWQTNFSQSDNLTLFRFPVESRRADFLRQALTNRGAGFHPDAKVLRFMENNDTFRFIATHAPAALARTRMAAALLFALPGLPLLYNGQEIGFEEHPYRTYAVFDRGRSIRAQDAHGLFPYYAHLIRLRRSFPALTGDHFAELGVEPAGAAGHVFAFRRRDRDEHVLGVVNLGAAATNVALTLPADEMALDAGQTYYLTDLFSGEHRGLTGAALRKIIVPVEGYTTRLFALSREIAVVPTAVEPPEAPLPFRLVLDGNHPNPFNPTTTLRFGLPAAGPVRLTVYDLLGREVAVLVDGPLPAGTHTASFDGSLLPSGLYLYRLQAGPHARTGGMVLLK